MRHKFFVLALKKWLKSMHIYGSYREIKTWVSLFGTTLYIIYLQVYMPNILKSVGSRRSYCNNIQGCFFLCHPVFPSLGPYYNTSVWGTVRRPICHNLWLVQLFLVARCNKNLSNARESARQLRVSFYVGWPIAKFTEHYIIFNLCVLWIVNF